jgi:hypothetical protein
MTATTPLLLDTLADCLSAGDSFPVALGKIGAAGPAAGVWAAHVGNSAHGATKVGDVLGASGLIDDVERTLLATEGAEGGLPALLRAVAERRRRQITRRATLLRGLVGPFLVAAITVVLDPLPNLLGDGDFAWPAVRGLLLLCALSLAAVVAVRWLFGDPSARRVTLRAIMSVPGARYFGALHLEEELTTALAPFAVGGAVADTGLRVAASVVAWSPIAEPLRLSGRADRATADPPAPMGGLAPLAGKLSPETHLAILGGVATKRLGERLAARGNAISAQLTQRTRLLVRVSAYGLVLVLSTISVVGMVGRGLPTMPNHSHLGAADQKQLDELMKVLEAQ